MAIEAVQAVRQAELNAIQIVKDAEKERNLILLKAEKEKEEIIISMTKETHSKKEQDLESARIQGTQMMEAAVQKAEQEIFILNEIIKNKEKVAICLVVSEVI